MGNGYGRRVKTHRYNTGQAYGFGVPELLFGQCGAIDPGFDFSESNVLCRKYIVCKRRKTTIIRCAKLLNWQNLSRFQNQIAHFFGGFNTRVHHVGYSQKYPLIGLKIFFDGP